MRGFLRDFHCIKERDRSSVCLGFLLLQSKGTGHLARFSSAFPRKGTGHLAMFSSAPGCRAYANSKETRAASLILHFDWRQILINHADGGEHCKQVASKETRAASLILEEDG